MNKKKKKDGRGHISENDFIKIDLHVHTPASTCYKGSKDDDEYLRILKYAKKRNIKILAITDHNSIRGYKHLLQIKNKLIEENATLSTITDSAEVKTKLLSVSKKLSVFEGLLILPGVEFEVSNGIHLLVVFNEKVQVDQVERFLTDGGYSEETFGREEPSARSKWDIFDLYEQSKKYDCIVIDAHTDARKGIWETIPSGRVRADCFRDVQLCAVGFKNEKQKENISQLLKHSLDYKRSTPLAFVRFSDAHHHTEIGSQVTWVKIGQNDFASLKTAFANPAELVSTEIPELTKILNDLMKKETAFGLADLNTPESVEECAREVCALNNSTGGYLLFGITPAMAKVGLPALERNEKGIPKIIQQIRSCFDNIDGELTPFFTVYPLQSGRWVISLRIPVADQLVTVKGDGRIYAVRQREITTLTGIEIQAVIEERTSRAIETRITKRISEVEKNCLLTKNLFLSMSIIKKFESKSMRIPSSPKVLESITLSGKEREKLRSLNPNGKSKGNIIFVSDECGPRLPYAYLRYSVPVFNLRNVERKPKERETIYIVPGGGVFYSKRSYPFYGEGIKLVLTLYKEGDSPYGMKFIVAYLKSSFLLWYLLNKLDKKDLYSPIVYRNIRVPQFDATSKEDIESVNKIEKQIDEIQKIEKEYLAGCQKVSPDALNKLTCEHNSKVDLLAYGIDQIIYKIVGLSEGEIETVENHLRLSDIYLPKKIAAINGRS